MLGLVRRLFGSPAVEATEEALQGVVPGAKYLPDDLVAVISAAQVYWRPDREHEGAEEPVIRIIGLGSFRFDGLDDCADRVARWDPDLTWQQCRRAAQLIQAQIGRRNLEHFGGQPRYRRSWRKPKA